MIHSSGLLRDDIKFTTHSSQSWPSAPMWRSQSIYLSMVSGLGPTPHHTLNPLAGGPMFSSFFCEASSSGAQVKNMNSFKTAVFHITVSKLNLHCE